MVKLNNFLLTQTSLAALGVIFGVVLKNSANLLKENKELAINIGTLFFVGGWAYAAYILSYERQNKLPYIVPSIAILITAMLMRYNTDIGQQSPAYLPIIFALSWIILGYFVGIHVNQGALLGLFASTLVLVSMMYSLPKQRALCMTDGIGMPLFTIAWVIIIGLNSSR